MSWVNELRDWHGRWSARGDEGAHAILNSLRGLKDDAGRAAIRRGTGGAIDTKKLHTDEHGNYTPERKALHEQIINQHFAGSSPQAHPTIVFTAGGAASGKSSLAGKNERNPERNLPVPKGSVYINPDEIKEMLPEYESFKGLNREDIKAEATHEESSDLAKAITALALQQRRNIMVDGVGNSPGTKFADKVNAAVALNYKTEVRYAHIPVEEALKREELRAQRTGRKVDSEVLHDAHQNVSRNYVNDIRNIVGAHVKIFSTLGQGKPVLIAEKERGKGVRVINREQYNEHVSKAGRL